MTDIIGRVAEDEQLSPFEKTQLTDMARIIDGLTDCLGFCMSEEGDALSQWRGYADDGRGVSIGFSERFLKKVSQKDALVVLQKVIYNIADQKRRIQQMFPRVKELIQQGALRRPTPGSLLAPKVPEEYGAEIEEHKQLNVKLFGLVNSLHPIWYSFKNPAFREENEWRLSMTILSPDKTSHRTTNGRLVPYREIAFSDFTDGPVIDHIILGPKHPTPKRIVESFLHHNGFGDSSVRISEASYR